MRFVATATCGRFPSTSVTQVESRLAVCRGRMGRGHDSHNFVMALLRHRIALAADGRAKQHRDVVWVATHQCHRVECSQHNAITYTRPARMNGRDHAMTGVNSNNRHTISGQSQQCDTGLSCHQRIDIAHKRWLGRSHNAHTHTMVGSHDHQRRANAIADTSSVLGHRRRVVTDVPCDVQTCKWRKAHSAGARTKQPARRTE